MHKYDVIIYWSDDDRSFVAEIPELLGCAAHGDTHAAALANVNIAVEGWLAVALEFGDAIPRPAGRRPKTIKSEPAN